MARPSRSRTPRSAGARPDDAERPWLASYPPGVPPTYDYPPVAVSRLLDDAARDFPDVAGTWYGGAVVSYAELLDRVDRLATALAALGVGPGDRVATLLPGGPGFVVALFATVRLGGVVVPLDPGLEPERLDHRLRDSGAEVAVTTPASLRTLEHVWAHLPALRHAVVADPARWLPGRRLRLPWRRRPTLAGAERSWLEELLRSHDPIARQAPVDADAPAALLYPSEDGPEEPARVHTHATLVAAAFQARLWLPDVQAGRERLALGSPPWTAVGLTAGVLNAALSAATLVLPRPERLLDDLAASRATILLCRPATVAVAADGRGLDALRICLVDEPADPSAAERLQRHTGARVRLALPCGQAGGIVVAAPVYGRVVGAASGVPVTDTLAAVEGGELVVEGPQLATGRWRGGAVVDGRRGRVGTGRAATVDADGVVTLTGVEDAS